LAPKNRCPISTTNSLEDTNYRGAGADTALRIVLFCIGATRMRHRFSSDLQILIGKGAFTHSLINRIKQDDRTAARAGHMAKKKDRMTWPEDAAADCKKINEAICSL